jgi:adenylate cyclase
MPGKIPTAHQKEKVRLKGKGGADIGLMRERESAFPALWAIPIRLPKFLEAMLLAGTANYPSRQRRGLIIANITGYLAAVSSLIYAVTYAAHDLTGLLPLVIGNVLSAICTASVPLLHRFGASAAALWLTAVLFSTMLYFIAFLGRDSGIQLNYIGAAAATLAVLGVKRLPLAVAIAVLALICHLAGWFLFPPDKARVIEDAWFLDQLYVNSAVSIMAIIFLIVFYGFRLAYLAEQRMDALLHKMMPAEIVQRLKEKPDETIADSYDAATILFADLKGFTPLSAVLGPARIVRLLDELFTAFDREAVANGMTQIKTIGDAYMAVAGLPVPRQDHAEAAIRFACALLAAAKEVGRRHGLDLRMRVGVASGPVMAGVIGQARVTYDVWGDTVNLAARLESYGEPGRIHVSAATRAALGTSYAFTTPALVDLKGIGKVECSFLVFDD